MKKIFYIFIVVWVILPSNILTAQRKKKFDILKSSDIAEIELFLKTANPNDSRRIVLKKKLNSLKNNTWKGAKDSKPIQASPLVNDETKLQSNYNNETEEFEFLSRLTPEVNKMKTVNLLNNLFTSDPSNKECIVLVRNHSNCNLIVRFGDNIYRLAVEANGENSISILKGEYKISSILCGSQYTSVKNIEKNLLIELKLKSK